MNTSYNHADFIGMCLESDDDYEPYGYADMLQPIEHEPAQAPDKSIECMLFGPGPGYLFYD